MAVTQNDVVRCVAQMQDVNGSTIENVYFYEHTGPTSMPNTDFLVLVEAELSTNYSYIEAYMPNSLEPVQISCDIVVFSGGSLIVSQPVGDIQWTTWGGGTATGEGLPQGCAAVINLPTVSPGVQGRKFMGPLTEGSQDGGILETACQTALGNFATGLLNGFTYATESVLPRIMSSKFSAEREIVGYQRRRKSGVGA